MEITSVLLSFFIFSFLGWCYESFLCSLYKYGRFINRGFLLGPCCPIYGAGAMLCWLLLRYVESLPMLFLASALCCSALEYITSWLLERVFHAKWWDYSGVPLNLHGRVCVRGAMLFGLMCVLICRRLEPDLLLLLGGLPFPMIAGTCALCCALLVADFSTVVISWRKLNAHLEMIRVAAFKQSNRNLELLSEALVEKSPIRIEAISNGLHLCADNWTLLIKKAELRFLDAAPESRIPRYDRLLIWLKLKEHTVWFFRRGQEAGTSCCYAEGSEQDVYVEEETQNMDSYYVVHERPYVNQFFIDQEI